MQTCILRGYPDTVFEVKSINGTTVNLSWCNGILEGDWMFNYQCHIDETDIGKGKISVTYNHNDLNKTPKIKQPTQIDYSKFFGNHEDDEYEDEEETPKKNKKRKIREEDKTFDYFMDMLK